MTNSIGAFDAVIFDMDGLLVESESVWYDVESKLIAARGKVYEDVSHSHLVGLRMDEFVTGLRELFQLSDTVEVLMSELTNRMLEEIPVKVQTQPGAEELIAYLMEQKIPCAIASSSPIAIVDKTVESRGWEQIFTTRCSAQHDARGKPAPDVYLRAAKLLNADPTRCLALEDSPNGARAAVAAGMTCYAVPDRNHTSPAAFEKITSHVFDSLHDVLSALKTHTSELTTRNP